MPAWKSVEATWKKLHSDFENKTAIQDYLVKKKKLKYFKVKKSGAKQIAKYLRDVDQSIMVYDIAGAEKALAKFQKTFADWCKQMDRDHIAFRKYLEKMQAGEVDITPEELKQTKSATAAFRLLVANVNNMEMTIENELRDLMRTKPAEKKVRFAD